MSWEFNCNNCGKMHRKYAQAFTGPYCTCTPPVQTTASDSAMTPTQPSATREPKPITSLNAEEAERMVDEFWKPSATPRTDSATNYCDASPVMPWVSASFARTLETELAAAKAECERLRFSTEGHLLKTIQQQTELARLRAEVEKWQSVAAQMSAEREHNANEAARLRAELLTVHQMACAAALERDSLRDNLAASHDRIRELDSRYMEAIARLDAENEQLQIELEANKLKGGGCQCAHDEACAHVRRAEKAEAERDALAKDGARLLHEAKMEYKTAVMEYEKAVEEGVSSFHEHNTASYKKGIMDAYRAIDAAMKGTP